MIKISDIGGSVFNFLTHNHRHRQFIPPRRNLVKKFPARFGEPVVKRAAENGSVRVYFHAGETGVAMFSS